MSNGMSPEQMRQILEHQAGVTGTITNDPITGVNMHPIYKQTQEMINDYPYQKLIPFVIAFLIFKWCFK